MYKNIKNLLFDFGGVIVSIEKQKAVNRFKEIGVSRIEEFLGEFRQGGIFLDYEEGKLTRQDFYAALREISDNKSMTGEEIDSAWLAFITEVPAYKLELLKELRKKYNLYLLSNTNPSVMGWADSENFTPEKLPISAYFDKSYMSYKIGHAKPDKGIFDYIIKDSGLIPSETLFFDDGEANIKAAEELGFQGYLTDQNEDLRKVFEQIK